MTLQRFAVEFEGRTVGVAVRLAGGFVFYSSDRNFAELDGRTFARTRAIERELKKVARRQQRAPSPFRPVHAFA